MFCERMYPSWNVKIQGRNNNEFQTIVIFITWEMNYAENMVVEVNIYKRVKIESFS